MFQLITTLIATSGLALANAGPGSSCSDQATTENDSPPKTCSTSSSTSSSSIPSAEAYQTANWPAHNKDITSKDFQGQKLPSPLRLKTDSETTSKTSPEKWITKEVNTQGKVVVLEFWATWCPPCRSASPILDTLQKENPNTLAVLAISGRRETETVVRDFIADHPVSYAHLFDEDQSVFNPLQSKSIPLTVILSSDGIIRWIGNPHQESFLPAVTQIIAADPMAQEILNTQAVTQTTPQTETDPNTEG